MDSLERRAIAEPGRGQFANHDTVLIDHDDAGMRNTVTAVAGLIVFIQDPESSDVTALDILQQRIRQIVLRVKRSECIARVISHRRNAIPEVGVALMPGCQFDQLATTERSPVR